MEEAIMSEDKFGVGSQDYFLTHLHQDHTRGLGASGGWHHDPLYGSPTTARLLPTRFPGIDASLVLPLAPGASASLFLSLSSPTSDRPLSVRVTTIPALHCPGSLMYLFSGDLDCMLYTGDFRWELGCEKARRAKQALLDMLSRDTVDVLYRDNTFWDPLLNFPSSRPVVTEQDVCGYKIEFQGCVISLMHKMDRKRSRIFVPRAWAFLKGAHLMKTYLIEKIVGLFRLGGVPPVNCGLLWLLLLAIYTNWTGDDNFHWLINYFSDPCSIEGSDAPKTLLYAAGIFSNRIIDNEFIDRAPSNHTIMSLDDPLQESFASFQNGIGCLRGYYMSKGRVVDVSTLFGPNQEVFTNPPGGPFYVTLVYKSRSLKFALWARDLYLMGWRGPHGTIEIKAPHEQRKNYMLGAVIMLPSLKNYFYLAPYGLIKIRLGPYALREAFEILYKYQGQCTDEVLQAAATVAAHLSEAGRLQCVYNDIGICYLDSTMFTLDSRTNTNSLWVKNYAFYSEQVKRRINSMLNGKTPEAINISKGIDIENDIDILNTIRILHRDGNTGGHFPNENCPPEPTEGEYDIRDDECSHTLLKGRKSANTHRRSDGNRRGNLKAPWLEGCPSGDAEYPSIFPSRLIEEWYPLVNVEKNNGDAEKNVEETIVESELSEKEGECADDLNGEGEDNVISMYKISELTSEASFAGYFNQFPAVRKMFDLNRKNRSLLKVPMRPLERITWPAAVTGVSFAVQSYTNMKGGGS